MARTAKNITIQTINPGRSRYRDSAVSGNILPVSGNLPKSGKNALPKTAITPKRKPKAPSGTARPPNSRPIVIAKCQAIWDKVVCMDSCGQPVAVSALAVATGLSIKFCGEYIRRLARSGYLVCIDRHAGATGRAALYRLANSLAEPVAEPVAEPARTGKARPHKTGPKTGATPGQAPLLRVDGSSLYVVPQSRDVRREQMWRTMRILKEFTVRELAIQASTEECVVDEGSARTYCRYLHKAGFLARKRLPRYRPALPGQEGLAALSGQESLPALSGQAKTSPRSPALPPVAISYRFLAGSAPGPLPPVVQCLRQVFDPNSNRVVWASDDNSGQF